MEDIVPCAVKDQEVFRRVWQRVMGEREPEDCPVEALPDGLEGDLPCACLEELVRGPGQPAEGREDGEQAAPEPSTGTGGESGPLPAENGPDRGNDLPGLWEAPRERPDRAGRMRRQVMEALEGWQFYRHLAKRARGNDARVLNALAGEEHRAARRLAAAYFLLTGVRYWPSELLGVPAIPSYWGALRGRHQAEQRRETDYRISADDWDDPDQLELYKELAEGAHERCRRLRALLEEDHMM